MSFSLDTKNELSRVEPKKKCCQLAEIAGFIRTSGSIGLQGFGKFNIRVTTENPAIARHYKKLIQEYFNIDTNLEYGESTSVKGKSENKIAYNININAQNKSEQILRECGILLVKEGTNYISDGIFFGIVKNKCCKKSYLRGVFLGTGTMSDPNKDYDLEFVLTSETMANDLKRLICSFVDLSCKIVKRGNRYIVYMKKADYISDTLALMGADGQVLKLEDIRITKGMRNMASRATNCDMANGDRALECAMRQISAINKINDKIGISNLSPQLFEVAKLRTDYPNMSLEALGQMANPKLTKSGVNSRLRKIEEIAKTM